MARPILRWAGSKRGSLEALRAALPPTFARYIEPFAGSACLHFSLGARPATLGDLNLSLISFYRLLRDDPLKLDRALRKLDPEGGEYYSIRAEMSVPPESHSQAAEFLYVNRFCFNGVYRTNRQGYFNVPRGNRTGQLPSRQELEDAARLLRGRKLVCSDFEETLSTAAKNDFVYLDPPYFTRPNVTLGEYGYGAMGERGDLKRLASQLDELTRRRVKWLVSYSASRTLLHYARPVWCRTLSVRRNVGGVASRRKFVSELLMANYEPRRP